MNRLMSVTSLAVGAALGAALLHTVGHAPAAFAAGPASAAPTSVSVSTFQLRPVIGLLGQPLGERITITGVEAYRTMLPNPLAVDQVNGHAIPQSVSLAIRGVTLKSGVHYRLEGYESGAFAGDPEWLNPQVQQPFQYRAFFMVTRVLDPQSSAKGNSQG